MEESSPVPSPLWTARRVRITFGLLLAVFVAAIDSSVVSTAVPTIAGQLGHFSLYPWLIAGYLLTSTTTVPLWGRLADIYGRRRVLLAGLAWFLAASVLCGSAPDMVWLITFRVLQGMAAGCLLPVALTTIGDLFTLEQRARMMGIFTSVWAVSALVGPAVGAGFLATIGWRWIFWINVPVLIGSGALLWVHRDAPPAERRGRLDYLGALTLTAGVALALLGLEEGSWPLVGLGVATLVVFAVLQRGAANPTIPMALLRHPVIGPATAAVFFAGTLMFALNAFIPLYVQGVLGGSAFVAGGTLSLAALGWSGMAVVSGRLLLRFGYQPLVVSGAATLVLGAAGLALQPAGTGIPWVAAFALLMGMGMGQLQTPLLVVSQSVVDWSSRGTTTALNQFSRSIGGAIGVPLLGALLTARSQALAAAQGLDPAMMANPLSRTGHLDAGTAGLIGGGLQAVFWVLLGVAVATLMISAAILALRRRTAPPTTAT
ncbi:MAG: MFS transporter [Candidatus Dormibacteraeota bacterium]|nr:MFS transporter [Candidatus Dormibacteraeota bacterium]